MSGLRTPVDEEGEEPVARFDVDKASAGLRLDAFLATNMPPHISRSRVKALILEGQIDLNQAVCTEPDKRLKPGDQIAIAIPEPQDAEPLGEDIKLEILFEDAHLVVINKPAGMVVHPAPGNWSGTLVNALIHHCGESLQGIGGVRRPGIVHRLDKETSGVMVVAKTQPAHAGLAAQFADHGRSGPLQRAYLALVWGDLPRNVGTINVPLGRSTANRLKRAVVRTTSADAREAITHYSVLRHLDGPGDGRANASLVECRLETGRTHQIRVHLAHVGHPLIGDKEYGAHFSTKANTLNEPARSAVEAFGRQALHAHVLGFAHPVSGKEMRFEAAIPPDMAGLIAAFDPPNQEI